MREFIVKKAYYSIGEVCDLTALKPHVLRYWETQFDVLHPTKNRAGNRVFRPKDIELILLVKNLLYAQKYTIEGANQKLLEMRKEGKLEGGQAEVLGPEFLASMKADLENLAKVLTPSEPLRVSHPPPKLILRRVGMSLTLLRTILRRVGMSRSPSRWSLASVRRTKIPHEDPLHQ
ncbi:MAG: MerR family transcriptional regulator [Gemmatimonadales bacterium]|nr:MAG: MerR family transcriptional regulator [Gemmatimonadales bacterium]